MENDNIIIGILRTIQSDFYEMKRDISDIKTRLNGMEERLVNLYGETHHHSVRIDRIDERLKRVEKRLELAD